MSAIIIENEPLWEPLRTSALNSGVGELSANWLEIYPRLPVVGFFLYR